MMGMLSFVSESTLVPRPLLEGNTGEIQRGSRPTPEQHPGTLDLPGGTGASRRLLPYKSRFSPSDTL